jgi:hypothetical protein
MRLLMKIPILVGHLILAGAPAFAFSPIQPTTQSMKPIIPVAQGCGPGWWRGPWGHCRHTPYSGPLPGGGWAYDAPPAYGYFGNGCPPGFWHGPWGHCRDTPYHGRLPDGEWQ